MKDLHKLLEDQKLVDIDVLDCFDFNDLKDLEVFEISDFISSAVYDWNFLDVDIIYYYNAIRFLEENDPSLMISRDLALDMGYNLENLNSELLASLLSSSINRDDFVLFISMLDDYLNNIDNLDDNY